MKIFKTFHFNFFACSPNVQGRLQEGTLDLALLTGSTPPGEKSQHRDHHFEHLDLSGCFVVSLMLERPPGHRDGRKIRSTGVATFVETLAREQPLGGGSPGT